VFLRLRGGSLLKIENVCANACFDVHVLASSLLLRFSELVCEGINKYVNK
jgi:hypothetical protein